MTRFGDTPPRGQQFRVQLNLQIPDGCNQNTTYESVRQRLLANFSNLPYFQVYFHGFGTQLWYLDAKLDSGVPSTGKWLRDSLQRLCRLRIKKFLPIAAVCWALCSPARMIFKTQTWSIPKLCHPVWKSHLVGLRRFYHPAIGLRVPCDAEQRWVMNFLILLDRSPLHLEPVWSAHFLRIGLTFGRALTLRVSWVLDSFDFAPPFQESQKFWRNIALIFFSCLTWALPGIKWEGWKPETALWKGS